MGLKAIARDTVGIGTVTSVGLTAAPSGIFDVSGSPVTGSGTLALSMDNQNANVVLAGPATAPAAAPAFRALVVADIPFSAPGPIGAGTPSTISATTGLFTNAGNPVTINNTQGAGTTAIINAQRGTVTRYYIGFNASDEFVLYNAAASAANLSVTDLGALTVRAGLAATSGTFSTTLVASGTIKAGGYTVGTLPANGAGQIAYVTDQLTVPAVKGAAPTGGGAVVCYVVNTGAGWVGI